ncbi:hypothetical protein RHECNPAF_2940074 [Rhizobium etli CNPAF512]|nr:hypothetical protein RHECNPAF_2940074 [Rhizobium etli CNPAF512]
MRGALAGRHALVFLVGVIGLRLVIGNRNGIGAGQPAGEIDLAAAVGAEGIMFAIRRLAAFGARAGLAQRFDLGGGFPVFRHDRSVLWRRPRAQASGHRLCTSKPSPVRSTMVS